MWRSTAKFRGLLLLAPASHPRERQYPTPQYLNTKERWADLASIGMVEAERDVGDTVARETHSYMASLGRDTKRIADAVREHWGIVNSVHWVLDTVFREDVRRVRAAIVRETLRCCATSRSTSRARRRRPHVASKPNG